LFTLWVDGRLRPWREGQLHYLSHGHNFGFTVFDSMRAYDGRIFKLTEHVGRLMGGARQLGMSVPCTLDQVADACEQVVQVNGLTISSTGDLVWGRRVRPVIEAINGSPGHCRLESR